MGLDSITSRVVVNGKLSNKKPISRRGKYTAFLRFPKRFCGADFIDNLINGNIKVRDSQVSNFQQPRKNFRSRDVSINPCWSLISKIQWKIVSLEFTNIKRMGLNQQPLYSSVRKWWISLWRTAWCIFKIISDLE